MKNDSKIICALQNDKLVYIEEVESGIKCNCYCHACGEPLIARKGNIKKHHFAHKSGTECHYGCQTSLHLMAKDILSKIKKIKLPALGILFDGAHKEKKVLPSKNIDIDYVELECKIGSIIPDVVVYVDGRPLCIEIFVTHEIDEEKRNKIFEQNLPVIEVDLSDLKDNFNKDILEDIFINDSERKKWIYSPKQKEFIRKYQVIANEMIVNSSEFGFGYVNYCPIAATMYRGKPRARVFEECGWCQYFAGYVDEGDQYNYPIKIYCNGKKKIDTMEDLKRELNNRKK